MALKATIYKATVNVADLDRNQFLDASLTLARHPSETQERMMLRLLAWLKYADERLQFTRGLCADDALRGVFTSYTRKYDRHNINALRP